MPKSLSLTRITNILLFAMILFEACSKKNNSSTPTLSLNTHSISMAALSGSKDTIKVSSSTSWIFNSSQSWLTVSASTGSGNSAVVVSGTANSGNASARSATLIITASGGPADTVNVIQDAGIIVVAGSSDGISGSGLNQLHQPYQIYLDAQDNVYIADVKTTGSSNGDRELPRECRWPEMAQPEAA